MDKIRISILILVGFVMTGYSQNDSKKMNWEEMILRPEYSFKEVQKAFYDRWKGMDYIKDDGYKLFKRWEYAMEQVVDKNGNFDREKISREYLEYKKRLQTGFYREQGAKWEQMGPFGFISEYGIGRVNVVGFDPNDSNVLWLGSPSGGLWKSINGGNTWKSYSNDFRMMGVSDIAIDPTNTNTMYIATGDRDAADTWCYGVLKSTDGGNTWASTNLPQVESVSRILLNYQNTQELVVATSSGIYKSTDGGESWSKTLSGHHVRYMEYKPGNPNVIYATDYSFSSVSPLCHVSNDGGSTFRSVRVEGMSSEVSVIAIGTSESNPEVVYLLAGINKQGWSDEDFEGVYKSEDSGVTFKKVNTNLGPSLGSQSWYDWTLTVSPDNPDELFAGGVSYYKSTDGGKNWKELTNWYNPNNNHSFHVDHHYSGFQPNTNILFVGNDGGLYKSENKGRYWTGLNEELSITQYYRVGTSAIEEGMVACGAQDNGTHLLQEGNWDRVMGGDGMDCSIDYSNSRIVFASYQFGNFRKSTNAGIYFSGMFSPDQVGEYGAWVTPFLQDPQSSNVLYIGYNSLWKSEDKGENWENISGQLSGDNTIRRIAVSPTNTDYIYVSYSESIYMTKDGGKTWNFVSIPFEGYINDIAVSPKDSNKIWIVGGDYEIHQSDDAGKTWNEITNTLPRVPITSVVAQNNDKESVYVGTLIGVFHIDNTLEDWETFNNGLPPVRIGELEITPQFGKLRAGTYGRGLWETNLRDFDENMPLCSDVLKPLNGSKIKKESVVFKWRKIENATGYKISIGTSTDSDDVLPVTDVGNTLSYEWNIGDLDEKVYVNIITYNEYGETSSCIKNIYKVGCYYKDRKALMKLYHALNGENWTVSWDTTNCEISEWYGVKTTLDGEVISIDLDGISDDGVQSYQGNNLSGYLDVDILKEFNSLKRLYLSGNKIDYRIFENIDVLQNLEELDLSKNGISGTFPNSLTELPKLKYLDLSGNNLTGELPSSIQDLNSLRILNLSDNSLTGELPQSIGFLPSCERLILSNNNFTGKLPTQIWYLRNLKLLNVSNNQFSGIISNQIGGASKLNYLYLNNNRFRGRVPKGLSRTNLYELDASHNDFYGCFDNSLKELCNLYDVDFSNNPGLPNEGNFSLFCSSNKGNCDFVPECSRGLITDHAKDSLYYKTPIKWKSVSEAKGYRLTVGTISGGNDILDNYDVGSEHRYKHSGLPLNVKLYINVLPYNDYGHSYGCDEFVVYTTDRVAIEEIEDEKLSQYVSFYPMPAKDFLTFTKNKSNLGEIVFDIVDLNGKKVLSDNIKAESKSKTINLKGLAKSVYFIKLTIDKKEYLKKLIIQ